MASGLWLLYAELYTTVQTEAHIRLSWWVCTALNFACSRLWHCSLIHSYLMHSLLNFSYGTATSYHICYRAFLKCKSYQTSARWFLREVYGLYIFYNLRIRTLNLLQFIVVGVLLNTNFILNVSQQNRRWQEQFLVMKYKNLTLVWSVPYPTQPANWQLGEYSRFFLYIAVYFFLCVYILVGGKYNQKNCKLLRLLYLFQLSITYNKILVHNFMNTMPRKVR